VEQGVVSETMPRSEKASRTWAGALLPVLLSLVLLTSGCSGDEPGESSSPTGGGSDLRDPSAAPTFRVAPIVSVGQVVGRVSKKHLDSAERQVSRAVMGWIEQAYLSDQDSDVRRAFAGFSPKMRKAAFRDRAVLSNAGLGGIERISPSALRITTDFLGHKGLPVGATSRVLLRYKTIGEQRHRLTVGGRVSLVHDSHGWRVISYDVHRGVR
jgi:hypothetical protein